MDTQTDVGIHVVVIMVVARTVAVSIIHVWPKESRVVYTDIWLVPSTLTTVQPAAARTRMADEAVHVSHGWRICRNEGQEDSRDEWARLGSIPDLEPLALQRGQMMQSWEEE